jgi:hypothetical protein
MRAVGTRYDGSFTPAGDTAPLPRINFWAIWNEPNFGPDLAPQAIDNSTLEISPMLYRGLLDAAWSALEQTGHGGDTILFGELAPAGQTVGDYPGNFAQMVPLRFLRALYCVDSSYHLLTGVAATIRGCPAGGATAAFRSAHPALFNATAFAIHPYAQGLPPNEPTPGEPDYAELGGLPNLERVLDTLQQVYGSSTRFPIYSTEFGYQTFPPEQDIGVPPALAAVYLNWSEYLSWRDQRLRSYDQYLMVDSATGLFATALEFANGTPKPSYDAYRMPIFLPSTATSSGHPLEVWGCVRPARWAASLTGRRQRVRVQFQQGGVGPFRTIRTVTLTDPYGYFDLLVRFPQTGTVRLAWSYPRGPESFSRTVVVTVR